MIVNSYAGNRLLEMFDRLRKSMNFYFFYLFSLCHHLRSGLIEFLAQPRIKGVQQSDGLQIYCP